MNLLAIYRAEEFSPGRVTDDRAIMDAVIVNLTKILSDIRCDMCREEDLFLYFKLRMDFDVILSMGRQSDTLDWLKDQQEKGVLVLNSPDAVRLVSKRENLFWLTGESFNPCCPPYWKKSESYSTVNEPVVFVENNENKSNSLTDGVVYSKHHEGEHIKFYGIGGILLDFYGGDAIISDSGEIHIIDINDWPSFSICREEAAKAIADYIIKKYENRFKEFV